MICHSSHQTVGDASRQRPAARQHLALAHAEARQCCAYVGAATWGGNNGFFFN